MKSLILRCALALAGVLAVLSTTAHAAVTTVGSVAPALPAGGGVVAGAVTVGDGSFGSVAVTAGTGLTFNGGVTLGNNVGGMGVATLSGFGSDWDLANPGTDMIIGDEGAASVTLGTSARIIVPDDTTLAAQASGLGNLSVGGLGTVYSSGDDMTVGLRGRGIVDVLSGGLVTSDVVIIGDLTTANGSVTVSGELSRWTASLFTVGDAGVGSVNVSGGGLLSTSALSTAVLGGSAAAIDVAGSASRWNVSGASTVGGAGTTVWNVTSGGRMTFDNSLLLASDATSRTDLTISGQNSRVSTVGGLSIGSGEATITIADDGVLAIGSASTLGAKSRVTLSGGRWEMPSAFIVGLLEGSGTLQIPSITISSTSPRGRLQTRTGDVLLATGNVTNSGFIDQNGGELEVRGVLANNGDIDLRNGAALRVGSTGLDNNSGSQLAITSGVADVFGAVDNNLGAEIAVVGGATAIFHDAFTSAGTLFVSASSEIALLENLSFVPSSILGVELASIAIGDEPTDALGMLNTSGSAALGGALEVSLANGFTPTLGETYQVVSAGGGRSGTFSTLDLPSLGGGLAFDVNYTSDAVILEIVASTTLPGDYNNDGTVNAADYTVWRDNLGSNVTLPNDTTSGNVAQVDYDVWKANFGAVAVPGALNAGQVPEPGGRVLALLIVGWSAAATRRRLPVQSSRL